MDEFLTEEVRPVITACENADHACPIFPGQMHRNRSGFDDPAHASVSEEVLLAMFRRERDEIARGFPSLCRRAAGCASITVGYFAQGDFLQREIHIAPPLSMADDRVTPVSENE